MKKRSSQTNLQIKNSSPLKVTSIYLVLGLFWIAFSDRLILTLTKDASFITVIQTYKGWFFVIATSILLYFLIKKSFLNLIHQHSLLNHIVETVPVGITIIDKDGKISFANKNAENVFGLTRDKLSARTYNDQEWKITSLDGSPFPTEQHPFSVVKGTANSVKNIEHSIEYPDGKKISLSINAVPIKDKNDNFDGMIASIEDITDRIQRENEIREAKTLLGNIIDRISDSFVALDKNWRYTYVNENAAKTFGKTREEMLGKHIWTMFPEGIGQPFHLAYEKAIGEQKFVQLEEYYPPYDKWFENRIYPSEDGLSIFFQDVTERKKSEEQLKMWEQIFQHSGWGIVIVDPEDDTLLNINPACANMYGYSISEAIGKNLLDFFAPEYKAELPKHIEVVNREGINTYESVHIRKDGSLFPVLITVTAFKDEKGKLLYRAANIIDITERKKIEEDLRENEEQFRTLAETTSTAIFVYKQNKFVYSNKAAQDISGYSEKEFLAKDFWSFVHPDFYEIVKQRGLARQHGEKIISNYEFKIICKDGSEKWLDFTAGLINWKGETASIGTAFDITGRKDAEEKILHANRVYAVISQINQVIVRTNDKNKLFEEACRIVIEVGKFQMAWVGLTDEETKLVNPVTFAGVEDGYLSNIRKISDSDVPEGRGPTGIAIREGKHFICNDIENDPLMTIWKDDALKRNYRSSIALPIKLFEKTIGAFTLYSSTPHFFDKEEIDLLDEVTNDISFALESIETEKKQHEAEEELRDKNARLLKAEEIARFGFLDWDLLTNQIFLSDKVYELYGLNKTSRFTTPEFVTQVVHPDDLSFVGERLEAAIKGEQDYNVDHRIVRPDGKIIWVQAQAELVKDQAGNPVKLLGTMLDITERKRAEETILESEEKYRTLVSQSPEGIFIIDLNGNFISANRSMCETLGYNEKELLSTNIWQIIPKEFEFQHKARLKKILDEGGIDESAEYKVLGKNGTEFIVEISSLPYFRNGKLLGIQGVARNITKQKKAEEALYESEERLRLSTELANVAVWEYDFTANSMSRSKNHDKLYGLEWQTKWAFETFLTATHPDDREFSNQTIQKSAAIGGPDNYKFDFRVVYPDQSIHWLEVIGQVVERNSEGQGIVVRGCLIDITERKKAEEEIEQTKREFRDLAAHLQTVREEERKNLAREMHDEIGQILTSMKMNLSLLHRMVETKEAKRRNEKILDEIKYMSQKVDRAVVTVRKMITELRPELLDKLGLIPALEWYTEQYEKETKIRCNFKSDFEKLLLDYNVELTIFRIVQEALTNVAKHSKAVNASVDIKKIENGLLVEVIDDGKGISQKELKGEKSFGLLGMRERANLVGGKIDFIGIEGKGTTVKLVVGD